MQIPGDRIRIPSPRIIDPHSVGSYRWGVIGAGGIAAQFIGTVQKHTTQKIVAVASRTHGRARDYGQRFGIESHDTYEALVSRDDVDIIYVATLPSQHFEHAMLSIAAGKHVLIEKPVALEPSEAREIFEVARSNGLLAMEAMWTRYLPQYDIIRQLLEDRTFGKIEMVNVSMCQSNLDMKRLFTKNGGDPLFDMGIYAISFCQTFLGNPEEITAQAVLNLDGIDEEVSAQLRYPDGSRAYVLVSGRSGIPATGQVSGTRAKMNVGPEFCIPSRIDLSPQEFYGEVSTWQDESNVQGHDGLCYQATAMAKFIDQGLVESPFESHADSIANLEVCEKIVQLIGAQIK
ncbi:Gfo/Idh/MocA family oxidoreductase [Aquiluna borgnonia]|uniref:Gfo/Idh/MocA family oxidoreductase n=1 Tax=Aquiluna borgnonia TaxID=2499157 RepID=A0A7D4TRY5_9MICO|nr:Gfo/Idh/MocA family oxidoreductase [Aquiluna borgnonia]QKJ25673.1 Gfo/Idh/MocA family oxidoreductase [Aquiluna borgnonia]